MKTALHVKYSVVDGMHFFTSGDDLTRGLCAANYDLRVAFEQVAVQCGYLLRQNHGVIAHVSAPASAPATPGDLEWYAVA